jgi:hypothetical protein
MVSRARVVLLSKPSVLLIVGAESITNKGRLLGIPLREPHALTNGHRCVKLYNNPASEETEQRATNKISECLGSGGIPGLKLVLNLIVIYKRLLCSLRNRRRRTAGGGRSGRTLTGMSGAPLQQ